MATNHTITLRGTPLRDEYLASGAIRPGMLIEPVPASSTNQARAHSTAGGTASPIFALEDDLQGRGIGTDYADGEMVEAGVFRTGDWVNALIADAEDIAWGDKLESNGDGYLREVDTDPSVGTIGVGSVVAWAREAKDMTGSSGVDPTNRIWVQIL
jgi:hypothetical protein